MLHREAATSDLDRLSRFFRELLSDPDDSVAPSSSQRSTITSQGALHYKQRTGLRGCFRDYLSCRHLAEHLLLAWLDMEQLKRACDRFVRCVKGANREEGAKGGSDDLRRLLEDTACKCDDMYNKYMGEQATHSVNICVGPETRADINKSVQHLLKVVERAYETVPAPSSTNTKAATAILKSPLLMDHKDVELDQQAEQVTAIKAVRKYVTSAQTKIFTTMLFDFLPGFITSEQSKASSKGPGNLIGADIRAILEKGVHAAQLHSAMGTPLSPVASENVTAATAMARNSFIGIGLTRGSSDSAPSDAVVASMQLHQVVADPCCSMYLESYLTRVADQIKALGVPVGTAPPPPAGAAVTSLGFTPDLVISCLLEIDDFKRSEGKYHRTHRANLILARYATPELGCQELIALKDIKRDFIDPTMFDLVYVLLSTRLLVDHAAGFLASPEFKDLERVLASHQTTAATVVDTAAKVTNIRAYVIEKLGLKDTAAVQRLSANQQVRAAATAKNVEDLLKTLEGVLSLALGRSLFKRFSIQQFQEENVCFYLEVMHYKNEQYLVPPDGSAIYLDGTEAGGTAADSAITFLNSTQAASNPVCAIEYRRFIIVIWCMPLETLHDAPGTATKNADPNSPDGEMTLAEMRRLRAEHICKKYIEVGSRRQINISSAMRNNILHTVRRTAPAASTASGTLTGPVALEDPQCSDDDSDTGSVSNPALTADSSKWAPPLNVFNMAQREVLHLMKLNLWLKFQGSPFYNSLNRQVRKRAAIGVMVKAGQISTALLQGTTSTAPGDSTGKRTGASVRGTS
ncbi:hypothetical protein JKP88DRAFT_253634 [Tribonema minus]|uniref:RGS domain-containing protein n=1 Tax=Tribonema minus TaxID=303371 RepID=A0A835Z6K3_9STRA|nr:hypothetical protein JKP88DRAFT_253634 [Tribonema minus]